MCSALFSGAPKSPTVPRRSFDAMCRTLAAGPTGTGEGGRQAPAAVSALDQVTVLLTMRSCAHAPSTRSIGRAGCDPSAAAHVVVAGRDGEVAGERDSGSSTSTRQATERFEADTPTRGSRAHVQEPEIWVTMLPTPLRGYGKASPPRIEGLSSRFSGPAARRARFCLSGCRSRHLRSGDQGGRYNGQRAVLRDVVTDEQLDVQGRGVVA